MTHVLIIFSHGLLILLLSTLVIFYIRRKSEKTGSVIYITVVVILTLGISILTIYLANNRSWWYLFSFLPAIIIGPLAWKSAGNTETDESNFSKQSNADGFFLNPKFKDRAYSIAGGALDFAFDDRIWKKFGYIKRPTYGEIFQFFRKDWKFELEKNLLIEFQIIYAASAIDTDSKINDNKELAKTIVKVLTGEIAGEDLWRSYKFENKDECVAYFDEGILSYLEKDPKDWHPHFARRLNLNAIPNDEVRAKITLGLADLGVFFQKMK